MNNSEDDANRVDSASITERWLANLVVSLSTLTVLASSFAKRDLRIYFAPRANNSTDSLIAVLYSVTKMILGLTLAQVCFMPC